MSKVAGWGVTARATAGKVGLAGFRIAGDDILNLVSAAIAFLLGFDVQKGGNVRDLSAGHIKFRHALIGAAVQNDGADLVATFVVRDEDRTDEIGTAFSA